MQVYILPNQVETFKKKVTNASKHLVTKPKMTFSEPKMMRETTITDFNHGWDGRRRSVRTIEVIEVEIDEITSGDWILVANVFYREGLVGMVNSEHYKDIPSRFGIDYARCDYCGHTHPNRKEAHIVYNTKTGEWMQVGTSCGKKMFDCGDIFSFTIQLYKYIDICMGCLADDFGTWCASVPDHLWQRAYPVDSVIAAVVGYRAEVSPEWEKSYYDSQLRCRVPGTTDHLAEYYTRHEWEHDEVAGDGKTIHIDALKIDDCYNAKVRALVSSLPDDTKTVFDSYNGDERTEEGFNSKIKRAFEDGFILSRDFYTVFFAVKMYEESLTVDDWLKAKEANPVGEYASLSGAELISKDWYEDEWGGGWYAKFNCNGVTYSKTFSNWGAFEGSFKKEDGAYYFSAKVVYLNDRRREVKLGGRARKVA